MNPATTNKTIPPSIYFGGCAYGVPYLIGVVKRMKMEWGNDFHKHTLICGGSIGAIVALLLVLGLSADEMEQVYHRIVHKAYYHGVFNHSPEHLLHEMADILEKRNCIVSELQGKFMCSLYSIRHGHFWSKSWQCNQELLSVLRSTIFIPFYCACKDPFPLLMTLDGAYGVSGNDFPHKDHTLFIGVDQAAAEINRSMTLSEMLWPRLYSEYTLMIHSGYRAFELWDGTMKKKVGVRHPNHIMIHLFTCLKLLQIILCYKWYLWFSVFSWFDFQFVVVCLSLGVSFVSSEFSENWRQFLDFQ